MKTVILLVLVCSLAGTAISQIVKPPKQIWEACYDADPKTMVINDQVTDKAGNTYITGSISEKNIPIAQHFFLLKYNDLGEQQWFRIFPVLDSFDVGKALALDNSGNVYVTGDRFDIICPDCPLHESIRYIFTLKYDQDGKFLWLNREVSGEKLVLNATAIAVADYGSVYVSGNEFKYNRAGYINKYKKAIAIKMGSDGITSWTRRVGDVNAYSITFDKEKSVIIAGDFNETQDLANQKLFVMKFAANGYLLWSQQFNETGRWGSAEFISADSAANIYINGNTNNTAGDLPYVVTVKYDIEGNQIWFKKESTGTITKRHTYGDFITDKDGNVSIGCTLFDEYTVRASDTSSNNNWYITTYNTAGSKIWSAIYDDSLGLDDNIVSIKTDGRRNVYVSGSVAYKYVRRGKDFLSTYAIARYDSQGQLIWTQKYNTNPNENSFAIGLGLDANNSLYVAGYSLSDTVIMKCCTVKFAKKEGGIAPQFAASNSPDMMAATKTSVSPNPCYNQLALSMASFSNRQHTVKIFDANGKMYQSINILPAGGKIYYNFSVSDLPPGIYLLRITDGQSSGTKKFVKN